MMDPKSFLKERLSEIFNKIESINIRYEYSESDDTHLIEVTPVSEFYNNEQYVQLEKELMFDFNERFFPSTILFLSENSLNEILAVDFQFIREQFSTKAIQTFDFNFSLNVETSVTINAEENNYSLAA